MTDKFDVTGYDKEGRKVFHLRVEAPNDIVARLYATGALQKTVDGAEAVHKAVKIETRQSSPRRKSDQREKADTE